MNSYETGLNDFEVMNVDHNEVSFHSKETVDSLKFVDEVHHEYK